MSATTIPADVRPWLVIWAVDVFGASSTSRQRTVRFLRALTRGIVAEVEPVHVWELDAALVPLIARDITPGVNPLQLAESALRRWLNDADIPGMLAPRFLDPDRETLSARTEALASYARAAEADLVVAGARGGREKGWLEGSFVETLIPRTDVPVLVVGPRTGEVKQLREILFTTDLSSKSRAALDEVARFARASGARLTLFHKLIGGTATEARVLLEAWGAEVRIALAEITVVVSPERVEESILAYAREMGAGGIVAVVPGSGRAVSLLTGAVSRAVIDRSPCPVWVLHGSARALRVASADMGKEAA